MKKPKVKFKYTAKGKQMLNDPTAFFESFMHKSDKCTGKLLYNGSSVICDVCKKETKLSK